MKNFMSERKNKNGKQFLKASKGSRKFSECGARAATVHRIHESVPDAGMHVNRSAPAHIHAIPSRARAGARVREERWRGRSRSCARWREELWRIEMERWRRLREGGREGVREGGGEPKTDRQRGIRSEKEGGGKKKQHKAQNRGQCN